MKEDQGSFQTDGNIIKARIINIKDLIEIFLIESLMRIQIG